MGILYDLYKQVMERKNRNEDGNEGRSDLNQRSRLLFGKLNTASSVTLK